MPSTVVSLMQKQQSGQLKIVSGARFDFLKVRSKVQLVGDGRKSSSSGFSLEESIMAEWEIYVCLLLFILAISQHFRGFQNRPAIVNASTG